MAVAAGVGDRGSVKVTRMMFELETACESEVALEDSRDVSVCSCHSFSLSFSPPAAPLNQKEGENTSMPMTGTPVLAVGKGGERLGRPQQEDSAKSRSRALQQPLVQPLWGSVATQQPGSLRALLDPHPTGRKDGAGQHPAEEHKIKHISMHPPRQQEH